MVFITIRFISEQQKKWKQCWFKQDRNFICLVNSLFSRIKVKRDSLCSCLSGSYIPFPGSQRAQSGCSSSTIIKAFLLAGMKKGEESRILYFLNDIASKTFTLYFMAYSLCSTWNRSQISRLYSSFFPTVCLLPLAFIIRFFLLKEDTQDLCFSQSFSSLSVEGGFFSWMPG